METRVLDVELTKQELIERSKKQAELVKEIEDLEAQKSENNKRIGDKIKLVTKDLQEMAREVRAGKKWVEVEIARTKDMTRCVEETVRIDTGEVIGTRALTPAEMQLDLVQGGASVRISADTAKKAGSKKN